MSLFRCPHVSLLLPCSSFPTIAKKYAERAYPYVPFALLSVDATAGGLHIEQGSGDAFLILNDLLATLRKTNDVDSFFSRRELRNGCSTSGQQEFAFASGTCKVNCW